MFCVDVDVSEKKWKQTIRGQFHQRFFARFFCTNVLFGSFSNYVLALAPKFRTKNARVNVDEIDGRGQFHQRFTSSFYVVRSQKHKKDSQDVSLFALVVSAHIKAANRMLMKFTPDVTNYFLHFLSKTKRKRHLRKYTVKAA